MEFAQPSAALLNYVEGEVDRPLTIMFAEIAGCMQLQRRHGRLRKAEAKTAHPAALQRLIGQFHGFPIKRTRDGLLAIFLDPVNATQFAWRACTETSHPSVRIRIGISRGSVNLEGDNDISGTSVDLAVRVMSAITDDGIAISASVKEYLDQEFGERLALQSLVPIEADLKGFGPTVYYRLVSPVAVAHRMPSEVSNFQRAADLLGGSRVLHHELRHPLDVHEALSHGLPREALTHLVNNLSILRNRSVLEQAIGVSLRTSQRFKAAPGKPLSKEQSGRAWKFAEILAKATEVLGSQEEAEQWLERPAIGLDQRRPIDLLTTPAGEKLVEEFLERLEYGVYA
jgi:putative toxin-antitoxin system antitoxin component (TIGR02293 family)